MPGGTAAVPARAARSATNHEAHAVQWHPPAAASPSRAGVPANPAPPHLERGGTSHSGRKSRPQRNLRRPEVRGGAGTGERTGSVWLEPEMCCRGTWQQCGFSSNAELGEQRPSSLHGVTRKPSLFQTVASVKGTPGSRVALGHSAHAPSPRWALGLMTYSFSPKPSCGARGALTVPFVRRCLVLTRLWAVRRCHVPKEDEQEALED